MAHISNLVPEPGERALTIGGTRAGKSAFQEWAMREVQYTRPDAMQLLVDSKPRYRAETERGRFRKGRKDASYRYSAWSKGPVVPHSVVADIWDDKPFSNLWREPGEIVILQSGETDDWKRIIFLIDAFVKANIGGRERRLIVDECLDFTSAIHGESTPSATYLLELPALAGNGISEATSDCIASEEYLQSSLLWRVVQLSSTSCPTAIWFTCANLWEFRTQNHPRGITFFGNGSVSRVAPFPTHSQGHSICQNPTWHNYPQPRRMDGRYT